MKLQKLSGCFPWLDTGTHESLTEATEFVKAVEKRTGLKITCIEEIAYFLKFIDFNKLTSLSDNFRNSEYKYYLGRLKF